MEEARTCDLKYGFVLFDRHDTPTAKDTPNFVETILNSSDSLVQVPIALTRG